MLIEFLPLLLFGFGFGLMHALDADHIMAVSMLSQKKSGFGKTLLHSAHWALGHGVVLLISGACLFGFGVALPESLQKVAEASVGILLVILGLSCFWQFRRDKLSLVKHSHDGVEHIHWHDNNPEHDKKHVHQPVFVGILHGLAGSAPALALIPAMASGEIMLAMVYLLLFSLGVLISMLGFGLGLAKLQGWLSLRYNAAFQCSRYALAGLSIGLGSFWLISAV